MIFPWWDSLLSKLVPSVIKMELQINRGFINPLQSTATRWFRNQSPSLRKCPTIETRFSAETLRQTFYEHAGLRSPFNVLQHQFVIGFPSPAAKRRRGTTPFGCLRSPLSFYSDRFYSIAEERFSVSREQCFQRDAVHAWNGKGGNPKIVADPFNVRDVNARSYVRRIRVHVSVKRHVSLVAHFLGNLIIPRVSRADTLNLACQTRGYPPRDPYPGEMSYFILLCSVRRDFTCTDCCFTSFTCFLYLFTFFNVLLDGLDWYSFGNYSCRFLFCEGEHCVRSNRNRLTWPWWDL